MPEMDSFFHGQTCAECAVNLFKKWKIMKNVFAFKIFCIELHKIQSKLTGKESLQQSNIDRFHEM